MKLIRFIGKKVHGYIDFDVTFKDDITILIGINGSGKTTILKLLQFILQCNIDQLSRVKYDSLRLSYSSRDKTYTIDSAINNTELKYKVSGIEEVTIPMMYLARNYADNVHLIDKYRIALHTINRHLDSLPIPCFLLLERNNILNNDRQYQMERYYDSDVRVRKVAKQNMAYLSSGLSEAADLLLSRYRRIREKTDNLELELIRKLFMSSFSYVSEEQILGVWEEKSDTSTQHQQISLKEIEAKLTTLIKLNDTEQRDLHGYIEKIERLTSSHSKREPSNSINLEYLVNIYQIERINAIETIIGRHIRQQSAIWEPITTITHMVNKFFVESKKRIEIDAVGAFVVHQEIKGKELKINIDELSSGEKQLIIMFSHLILSSKDQKRIFIIDEPELSLHITWQEMLLTEMASVLDNTQFILATHSPDIIGVYAYKTIDLNRKK